jgi:hypothetical protein
MATKEVAIYNRIRHVNKVHCKSHFKQRASMQLHSQIGLSNIPVVIDFSPCKGYAAKHYFSNLSS